MRGLSWWRHSVCRGCQRRTWDKAQCLDLPVWGAVWTLSQSHHSTPHENSYTPNNTQNVRTFVVVVHSSLLPCGFWGIEDDRYFRLRVWPYVSLLHTHCTCTNVKAITLYCSGKRSLTTGSMLILSSQKRNFSISTKRCDYTITQNALMYSRVKSTCSPSFCLPDCVPQSSCDPSLLGRVGTSPVAFPVPLPLPLPVQSSDCTCMQHTHTAVAARTVIVQKCWGSKSCSQLFHGLFLFYTWEGLPLVVNHNFTPVI